MQREARSAKFSSLMIVLHWAMAALIIAVYACILLRVQFPRGSGAREGLKTWHFQLGLAVFALVWLRLIVRLMSPVPEIVPRPPRWQRLLAAAAEILIYAFMIIMPLLGWLILSGEKQSVPFFGAHLFALMDGNEALAKQFEEAHETLGNVGYFLIGLHAVAALAHHYFFRDNTLVRILPWAGLRKRPSMGGALQSIERDSV